MELAMILALLAVICLAVLVVQARPRGRPVEDDDWEILARDAEPPKAPSPKAPDAPATADKAQAAPAMAGLAKANTRTNGFWAAVEGEPGEERR